MRSYAKWLEVVGTRRPRFIEVRDMTSTHTKANPADLEAVKEFPRRVAAVMAEMRDMIEACERLEKAGYPVAGAIRCALTAAESLDVDEFHADTERAVSVAELTGWEAGAYQFWFRRVNDPDTIDQVRTDLANEPTQLGAFAAFNSRFEAEYPALAQKLSVAINGDDSRRAPEIQAEGKKALEALRPELESAIETLVADRQLATA
jgi:hypothetical protein